MSTKYEDGTTDNLFAFFSNLFCKNSEYKTIKFLESIIVGKTPRISVQTDYYDMKNISQKNFKDTFNSLSAFRKKQLRILTQTNDFEKNKIAISIFLYFMEFQYQNVFFEITKDELFVNGCAIKIEKLF